MGASVLLESAGPNGTSTLGVKCALSKSADYNPSYRSHKTGDPLRRYLFRLLHSDGIKRSHDLIRQEIGPMVSLGREIGPVV